MTLLPLLDRALLGAAERPALDADTPQGHTEHFTFGDLEVRSNRWAVVLHNRGIRRGSRLAFLMTNRVEIVDLWLACMKLGAIAVPINVLYQAREIAHIVSDAEPVAVVTTLERAPDVAADVVTWDVDDLARDAHALTTTFARPAVVRDTICDADTPLALVYTSGTTGASKGAILVHGNFASNALVLNASWGMHAEDRLLCTLPLFHVHGLANALHCWLLSGCHMKLAARFEASRAVDWFTTYRPTVFFGVPTMYVRLLDIDEATARTIGSHARLFVCGSAPLPAHVLESFRDRFGHVILERYGMTETLMNVSNPYVGERRAGTVGLPLALTCVRIVDESGRDVPDGTSGELLVRGPNVCAGYWNRPEATARAFVDGWFRTGDIGVRAADGYITLEGRRSELIISGGFNIYPREIEEVLLSQPGIHEAAVVGVPDASRGEVPVAYLVCDPTLDLIALETCLRTQLASFKIPSTITRVDALPRTALGKVQKHLLPSPT
ncbi:MAG: AMP-binding protein [Gemmatimonadaceae bacterium]|nr:AMP-binding protein [Gemmatimonadaceae bacterium]